MSARPLFLSHGRRVHDFLDTEGHTQPAVTAPQTFVDLVTSEGGARLDTHRVLPAQDWLTDSDLGALEDGATPEQIEEKRRAAVRARLVEVQKEWRISRREWLLYAVAWVIGVGAFLWAPNPGEGWSIGKALESLAAGPR